MKHPFLVQKRGGKFFSGRVGKHELGVGNYRQSGRKQFSLACLQFYSTFFRRQARANFFDKVLGQQLFPFSQCAECTPSGTIRF